MKLFFTFATTCLCLILGSDASCANLENPCGERGSIDVDCVRDYLQEYGGAIPVENGCNFDPHKIPDFYMYLPAFNFTSVGNGNILEGLSNTVLENFVVDYDNNVTIIYLNHTFLRIYGRANLWFHQPGAASFNVSTIYENKYNSYTNTIFIPGFERSLEFTKRQIHYYLNNFTVTWGDDNLTNYINKNALVAKVVNAINNNLATCLEETHLTMSKRIADGYIGQNLFDLSCEEPVVYPRIL